LGTQVPNTDPTRSAPPEVGGAPAVAVMATVSGAGHERARGGRCCADTFGVWLDVADVMVVSVAVRGERMYGRVMRCRPSPHVVGVTPGRDQLDTARDLLGVAAFELSGTSQRVTALGGAINAARVALVDTVAEWDRDCRWAWDGATSPEAWLVDRVGVSRSEANQVVAVARLCARFGHADAALHGGLEVPDYDPAIDGGHDVLAALRGNGPVAVSFAHLAVWARVVTPQRECVFDLHGQRNLALSVTLNLRETKTLAAKWASIADDVLGLGEPDDYRRRGVTFSVDNNGVMHLKGVLDAHNAALVQAAFDAMDRPDADDTPGGVRTPAQRRADDLGELARRFLTGADEPETSHRRGSSPTHHVIVFANPDDRCGETADGHVTDPGLMDLFACTAWFSKITFDDHGEVLDLSRRARLFSAAQRKAVIARDRHCQFPGCDRPPSWCDVHHVEHWQHGGPTNLTNGVLICHQHHRLLHTKHWALTPNTNPTTTNTRNRWTLDQHPPKREPDRQPDRQPIHQRCDVPA
jgi:hypothetical protein